MAKLFTNQFEPDFAEGSDPSAIEVELQLKDVRAIEISTHEFVFRHGQNPGALDVDAQRQPAHRRSWKEDKTPHDRPFPPAPPAASEKKTQVCSIADLLNSGQHPAGGPGPGNYARDSEVLEDVHRPDKLRSTCRAARKSKFMPMPASWSSPETRRKPIWC